MSDVLLENAVILIAGARGTGKTTLATTYAPPTKEATSRVFYHGSERSANRVVQELARYEMEFGHFVELSSRFANLPGEDDLVARVARGDPAWETDKQKSAYEQVYEFLIEDVDKHLIPGEYDVYVHDTIATFEAAMVAWADKHVKKLGVKGTSKGSGWGEYWIAGYYNLYDGFFESIFSRGVKTIILTTHLKNYNVGGNRVVGKVVPGGKPWLSKQTSLVLWVVNNRDNPDGAPAGLVLKERLLRLAIVDGRWQPRRMLPERIPHCTWWDVEQYLENGCDLTNPAPGETMTEAERQMISPLLTDEQMRLMVLDAQKELETIRSEQSVDAFGRGTSQGTGKVLPGQATPQPPQPPQPPAPAAPTQAVQDLRTRIQGMMLDMAPEHILVALSSEDGAPPRPVLQAMIREVVG
jgi:hypothetical protein